MWEKKVNRKKDYHSKVSFFTYGRLRGLSQVYLTGTPHTVQESYHQDETKKIDLIFQLQTFHASFCQNKEQNCLQNSSMDL
jgi:hypothetical protein